MLNQCSTIVECIQQFQTGMVMTGQIFHHESSDREHIDGYRKKEISPQESRVGA